MPTLDWIGKGKAVNHHLEGPNGLWRSSLYINTDASKNMIIRCVSPKVLRALHLRKDEYLYRLSCNTDYMLCSTEQTCICG